MGIGAGDITIDARGEDEAGDDKFWTIDFSAECNSLLVYSEVRHEFELLNLQNRIKHPGESPIGLSIPTIGLLFARILSDGHSVVGLSASGTVRVYDPSIDLQAGKVRRLVPGDQKNGF